MFGTTRCYEVIANKVFQNNAFDKMVQYNDAVWPTSNEAKICFRFVFVALRWSAFYGFISLHALHFVAF